MRTAVPASPMAKRMFRASSGGRPQGDMPGVRTVDAILCLWKAEHLKAPSEP